MTTETKADQAPGAKQPLQLTHEQMKASLTRDLDTLAALLNFIRSTPSVVDLISEHAVGIQNNILNSKALQDNGRN